LTRSDNNSHKKVIVHLITLPILYLIINDKDINKIE